MRSLFCWGGGDKWNSRLCMCVCMWGVGGGSIYTELSPHEFSQKGSYDLCFSEPPIKIQPRTFGNKTFWGGGGGNFLS